MKKRWCSFAGVIVYALLVIGIVLINPSTLAVWIAKWSSNPLITLWSVSILISSLFYLLPKISGSLKIQIPIVSGEIGKKIVACWFSLPYIVLGVFIAIGMIGIFSTKSPCQPPVVTMTATFSGNVQSISAGSTLYTIVTPSALLKAKNESGIAMVCNWKYAGEAITSMPQTGCDINVLFSQNPGDIAVVTLHAMDSSCYQISIFSFHIEVK